MKKVGKYIICEEIGRGAFGSVRKCHEENSQVPFAVKVVPLTRLSKKLVIQLEREISVMKLVRSPYIVGLVDVMRTESSLYIVMEYCEGGDLEHFKNTKKIPELLAKRWFENLLEAFVSLQQHGVLHRDLKLANILLSHADSDVATAKIADFGLARFLSEAQMAETILGTPLFMAPEVLNRRQYNYKVDVWSLGVIAYEIFVGRSPFLVNTMNQLIQAQSQPLTFPDDLPLAVQDLLRRMISYDPDCRPSFEDIKKHPFFTAPDPILSEFDCVGEEAIQPHFNCEEATNYVEDNLNKELLTIEYQYATHIALAKDLSQKYRAAEKHFIAFGICMMVRDRLRAFHSQLIETSASYPPAAAASTEKLLSTIQIVLTALNEDLEEMQTHIEEADLMRSTVLYRDTGICVQGRLLMQEAALLQASLSCLDRDGQIAALKDAIVLMSVACNDADVEASANHEISRVSQELKTLEEARGRSLLALE